MKKRLPSLEQSISINGRGANKLLASWFKCLEADVAEETIIIGIDEVGRGPVFGPMVLAACANLTGWRLGGVKDSKQIRDEKKRKALAGEIQHNTVWQTAIIPAECINRFGTLKSLVIAGRLLADQMAAKIHEHLPDRDIKVIFDGRDHKNELTEFGEIVSIEKADATVFEVSCASIVAKSLHDSLIKQIVDSDDKYRRYGVLDNKGYGTPKHKAAIAMHGLSDQHRTVACQTLMQEKRHAKSLQSAAAG